MSVEFDWDKANRDHIAVHGVTPEEFEEVFFGDKFEVSSDRQGEARTAATGKTKSGRLLTIVYTIRNGKVRPITARMVPRRKRKLYEEKIRHS